MKKHKWRPFEKDNFQPQWNFKNGRKFHKRFHKSHTGVNRENYRKISNGSVYSRLINHTNHLAKSCFEKIPVINFSKVPENSLYKVEMEYTKIIFFERKGQRLWNFAVCCNGAKFFLLYPQIFRFIWDLLYIFVYMKELKILNMHIFVLVWNIFLVN